MIVQALFNWEPLELPENGSYVVVSLGPANNFTGRVLDSLELGGVRLCRGFTSNSLAKHRGTRYLSLHLGVLLS